MENYANDDRSAEELAGQPRELFAPCGRLLRFVRSVDRNGARDLASLRALARRLAITLFRLVSLGFQIVTVVRGWQAIPSMATASISKTAGAFLLSARHL